MFMYFVLVESTIHANLEIKNRNNTWLVTSLSLFSVKRKVKNKLGYSISKAEEHCLEAKNRLHLSVREDLTDLLCLESGLREVRIIDDDALDI